MKHPETLQRTHPYCGWPTSCTILKPWEAIVCRRFLGNHHSRVLGWCRILSTHSSHSQASSRDVRGFSQHVVSLACQDSRCRLPVTDLRLQQCVRPLRWCGWSSLQVHLGMCGAFRQRLKGLGALMTKLDSVKAHESHMEVGPLKKKKNSLPQDPVGGESQEAQQPFSRGLIS